ncbi:MAG: hypothetical protein L0H19_07715 [Salinisphaera sp.]|nr:hypothetical protein [Salinisphaera sp.]
MTEIAQSIPEVDDLFARWKDVVGKDFTGYRNHAYRMLHFCLALRDCSDEEKQKLYIACVFHDLGVWTDQTLDYIDPSVVLAQQYLGQVGLSQWSEEIGLMIGEHHKLRSCPAEPSPLVEVFRRGDLVDFSLGLFRFDLPKGYFKQVRHAFPNAGFHKGLCGKASRWFIRHPLNPAPMMKW